MDDFIFERVVEIFKLLRSALKNNRSIIEGENAVGDKIHIRNIMADQDRSKTEFSLILGNHTQDCIFPNRILAGSGFVEEDNLRIGYQGPRQGRPFLHTPRQF